MRLARGFSDVATIRRSFRRTNSRWPSAGEIAALHPERHGPGQGELLANIEWLLRYSAPVALLPDGEPFLFASRTVAGRRQQFNLHLDRLFLHAATEIIHHPSSEPVAGRRRFEHDHSVVLHDSRGPLSDAELARPFEDRALRRRFIEAVIADAGEVVAHRFLGRAAKERVSAMVNAWRNAPIQGGVADIMLAAYADLHLRLGRYPDAKPVQTVHDSVVIECAITDAPRLVEEVRQALERASSSFCPDVVPKADVDIRRSLSEADILPADEV